jgi:hypothetical protein
MADRVERAAALDLAPLFRLGAASLQPPGDEASAGPPPAWQVLLESREGPALVGAEDSDAASFIRGELRRWLLQHRANIEEACGALPPAFLGTAETH